MLSQESLKQLLLYNPETGIFTWLKTTSNRVKPGEIAGYLTTGYVMISIGNREYPAHRLAWLYMTGSFPENDIDHINLVRDDNRWSNLRKATRSQNCLNKNKQANNTSGFKNVWFNKQRNNWQSTPVINGVRYYLGSFKDPKEAFSVYEAFAKEKHSEFYRREA